jgi:hypothetical protein
MVVAGTDLAILRYSGTVEVTLYSFLNSENGKETTCSSSNSCL